MYQTQARDTSREAEQLLLAAYRRMSAAEKGALIGDLKTLADDVAMAGIKARHPSADERELRIRLGVLKYGADLMRKVFSWNPAAKGY